MQILQALVDLQQELRDRFANTKSRHDGGVALDHDASAGHALGLDAAMQMRAGAAGGATSSSKASALLDDAQLTIQKLKREVSELKGANAKLVLTNSQLEDDVAHLQRCFEDEKRAHLNSKKLHLPKAQKVRMALCSICWCATD